MAEAGFQDKKALADQAKIEQAQQKLEVEKKLATEKAEEKRKKRISVRDSESIARASLM